MNLLYATLVALLLKVILDELLDWFPWAAQQLIRRAAKRLPPESRERYCEEWLAELDAVPGKGLSKFGFAFLVLWNARGVCRALGEPSLPRRTRFLLRLLDVVVSGVGLVAFIPVFALLGLALRLDSRGPVFVRRMYFDDRGEIVSSKLKFRTTTASDASDRDPESAVEHTRIGRFLRRFSLDELPALYDVVRGHISLVGKHGSTARQADAFKPGWVDWRIAFERRESIDVSADSRVTPDWAPEWKPRHVIRVMALCLWYVSIRRDPR